MSRKSKQDFVNFLMKFMHYMKINKKRGKDRKDNLLVLIDQTSLNQ